MRLNMKQIIFIMGMSLLMLTAGAIACRAEQPDCVGDRHLDECGQNCPVCPDVCAPVLPCPDPAPCQPVTCKDGNDGTSTVVEVDRCPQPEVSELCKVRRNGTVVCPRSRAGKRGKPGPRKILVPRSIVDQIADVERY